MKYQKSKTTKSKMSSSKSVIFVTSAIIIVILLFVLVLEKRGVINLLDTSNSPTDTTSDQGYIDYSPPSEEELQASEDEKIDNIDSSNSTDIISEDVSIDAAYYDKASGELVVKTKLLGLNWSTCNLTALNGSQEIKRESKTIYQPEYSICQGFAIAKSEFGNSGEWSVQLSATTIDGTVMNSEQVKVAIEL